MKRNSFILLVFLLDVTATASAIYVGKVDPNDPNACVATDYSRVCPVPVDPNLASLGYMIKPPSYDSNDPNNAANWTVSYGKLNWELFPCDPDNDPLFVDIISTNALASDVVVDPNTNRMYLVGEVRTGVAWWHLRITDVPIDAKPKSTDAIATVWVDERVNHAPVFY